MKIAMFIVTLVMLNTCEKNEKTKETSTTQFKYEASTRGSSYICEINEKEILLSSTGTEVYLKSKEISRDEWTSLVETLKSTDLTTIGNLVAPSKESNTDKVRIATLSVTTMNQTYVSTPFDEGNPPSQLSSILNNMLAIAKTVD